MGPLPGQPRGLRRARQGDAVRRITASAATACQEEKFSLVKRDVLHVVPVVRVARPVVLLRDRHAHDTDVAQLAEETPAGCAPASPTRYSWGRPPSRRTRGSGAGTPPA